MNRTSKKEEYMRLADKVALITGGTSGIGEATALLFSKEGARIAITGRNESRGQEVAKKIKEARGEVIFMKADVSNSAECRQTVDKTLQTFGRIDILFNNAGVYFHNTVVDCPEEEWDLTLDINLKGTYLMSKFALPAMIAQGSGVIINNSSGWGLVGGNEAASYCASKGGVVLLTKAMAIDHGAQGIRINCICPGDVDTPMLTEDARQRGQPWKEYLVNASDRPLGRIGKPDEIANAALFLASEDSSFMTGAILAVDGGGTAD
ncbi:MAG: glucose 1-dehydrogenase [Candidatus Aminicenantes bacterium]|nr:glucose 1-dehydrogenase [Candidatus Aminicenantes bacterium]